MAVLSVPGIGPQRAQRLLDTADGRLPTAPAELLEACRSLAARERGMAAPSLPQIGQALASAEAALRACYRLGVAVVAPWDSEFPVRAKEAPGAPVLLFVRGNASALAASRIITLVGTRRPTPFAQASATRIAARCVANGFVVLSGLALGCDTAAHRGCLDAAGQTCAVLAHGLDSVYPRENRALAERICATGGCLVSEYGPGTPPAAHQLVRRDRLQAVFADAVLVIQTSVDGGSMHAARHAVAKLRRPLGVLVPTGESGAEFGGNTLLQSQYAATPIANTADLLAFLGGPKPTRSAPCAVLFDLDQTLVDSVRIAPLRDQRRWPEVWRALDQVRPQDGASELLDELRARGTKIGLVTSAPRRYATLLCQRFGWTFDVVVAYQDAARCKPFPDPLVAALHFLGIPPNQARFVGDNDRDRLAASHAGVGYVAVAPIDPELSAPAPPTREASRWLVTMRSRLGLSEQA